MTVETRQATNARTAQVSTHLAFLWTRFLRDPFAFNADQAKHAMAQALGFADWAHLAARRVTDQDDTQPLRAADGVAWLNRLGTVLAAQGLTVAPDILHTIGIKCLDGQPGDRFGPVLRAFNRTRRAHKADPRDRASLTRRALAALKGWDDAQFEFYIMDESTLAEAIMEEVIEAAAIATPDADIGFEHFDQVRLGQAIAKRSVRHARQRGW